MRMGDYGCAPAGIRTTSDTIDQRVHRMRQFRRTDRLNAQMLRDISRLLDGELAEIAPGITTFTAVRLSSDLRYAKVYYSFLGDEKGRQLIDDHLRQESGRIRSEIGRNLTIRHVPELTFRYDPSVEEGFRIEQLLNDVRREQNRE